MEDFTQPDCKHLCCDVCAQSCKCGDCSAIAPTLHLEDVDIEEIDNFEPPLVTPRSKSLPQAQQDALKKELEAYRYRLCESTDTPGASLMVGLDIATGLSNALINMIAEHAQCFSVTDIDSSSLLSLGVCSLEQADAILCIIRTCLTPHNTVNVPCQ